MRKKRSQFEWTLKRVVAVGDLVDICKKQNLDYATMYRAYKNNRLAYGMYELERKIK